MTKLGLTIRGMIERALERFDLPSNESVVRLLLMIAAHESGGFTYCKQVKGPALGLFQMEPFTYNAVIQYLERTAKFPRLTRSFPAERLVTDPEFAAAFARAYLYSFPEALPDADDLEGLAEYAKKYWNTSAGKATPEKYLNDFKKYVWADA